MPQRRQLAAIMFTDIEGYTSVMQENEQQALQWKNRHRKILQREHKQFNGRIIQFYGDGTLSIFFQRRKCCDLCIDDAAGPPVRRTDKQNWISFTPSVAGSDTKLQ